MKDMYFKKDKSKFKIGNSDIIFKYDNRKHNLESLQERFIACDKNGKNIKVEAKASKKETK